MLTRPAIFGGSASSTGKAASSVACLAFVALLATAFWAGALWIGETLVRILVAG